ITTIGSERFTPALQLQTYPQSAETLWYLSVFPGFLRQRRPTRHYLIGPDAPPIPVINSDSCQLWKSTGHRGEETPVRPCTPFSG
ncbi:MAG: hypothetical protein ACPGXX_14315, partial [Planctomycetaceae bacterium]